MKSLLTLMTVFSLTQFSIADDKVNLQQIYKLTEPVKGYAVFDLPRGQLAGSPSSLFKGDSINSIVTIADGPKNRQLVGIMCQELINIIRSGKKLGEFTGKGEGRAVGIVTMASGRVVLVREHKDLLIVQVGDKAGVLSKDDFSNLKGIYAKIIK